MPNSRLWSMVVVVGLGSGCQGAAAPSAAKQDAADRADLEAVAAESRLLSRALNQVEGQLLGSRTTVKVWEELSTRHHSVSAVACRNAESHAEGMAWHEGRNRSGKEAHRVAEATTGLVFTDVHVTGYRTAASVLSTGPQQREGRSAPSLKK